MFFTPKSDLSTGACIDLPEEQKEWFFSTNDWAKAKRICIECPAKDACADLARREEAVGDKRYGVFGAMSAAARTKEFG